MAEAGLFVGWGAAVHGRERKALEVFQEAIDFYAGLQQSGRIEGFDTVLLEPHGGDLYGFFLLRGGTQQLAELRGDEGFERLTTRAGLVVDRLGVVNAFVDDGLGRAIGLYQEAVGELA